MNAANLASLLSYTWKKIVVVFVYFAINFNLIFHEVEAELEQTGGSADPSWIWICGEGIMDFLLNVPLHQGQNPILWDNRLGDNLFIQVVEHARQGIRLNVLRYVRTYSKRLKNMAHHVCLALRCLVC